MAADFPVHQVCVRDDEAVHIYEGPMADFSLANTQSLPCTRSVTYTEDGTRMALVNEKDVKIYDTFTKECVQTIGRGDVEGLAFSPLGTFVVTYERKAPDGKDNVFAFNVATGEPVLKTHQKEMGKDEGAWPPIRWTPDEQLCAHMVKSEIRLFNGHDPSGEQLSKIRVKKVRNFEFSPSVGKPLIATFTPPQGAQPARVSIWAYPAVEEPIASKSFFKADTCKLKWNPQGTSVLIETCTDLSAADESYYGETGLYLLGTDGNAFNVPFEGNDGPVQDCRWAPSGREFIAIQGKQPAQTYMFMASNCTLIRKFGNMPVNHVRWSPHGRFICLAGFGNLAGGMDFWDKPKFKKMGDARDRDGAKSYEWTPDGRNFITAVLRPWRRVDNGFKIYTYYGELIYHEKIDRLYQVAVRPAPGKFPDRPQSPRLKAMRAAGEPVAGPVAKAYVPPHLRGKGGGASQIMKRQVEGPKRVKAGKTQAKGTIPGAGAPQLSANQLKRQKKKAAKAKKEAEAKRVAEAEAAAAKLAADQAKEAKLAGMSPVERLAKELKKTDKKLRAVVKLEEKKKAGQAMDASQLKKISTGPQLRAQVAELKAKIAAAS